MGYFRLSDMLVNRGFYLVFFYVLLLTRLFGQESYSEQNARTAQNIKANREEYLWGEGSGKTLRQADKRALDDLVGQISVHVSSDFESIVQENSDELKEYSESVIKTYSRISLQEAERLVISQDPKVKVLRYLPKSEVQKIFEKRQEKIFSLVLAAQDAASNYRIGDALKNYYWALVLLQTHPDHNKISFAPMGKGQLLKIALHNKLENLFSEIHFNISDLKKYADGHTEVTISFTYGAGKQPVENLDFTFWNGKDWSVPHGVKDGLGYFELHDQMSRLKIRIKYIYDKQSSYDKELESAILQTEDYLPFFSKNQPPPIPLQKSPAYAKDLTSAQTPKTKEVQKDISQKELKQIRDLLQSISTKNKLDIQKVATPEGAQAYQKLIKYGNAKLLTPKKVESYGLEQRQIVRAFPMSFDFPKNDKQFVESVVLSKNADDGKVQSMSFALNKRSYDDIMNKHKKWDEQQKRLLIDFIEHYKTSYALRRIDYLEKVFSEDALIIVGSKLKKTKQDKDFLQSPLSDKVIYKKLSKFQFISRLKRVFSQKDYVNIQFGATRFKMSKVDGVYGVNIEQNYYSSNYSDKGYLFLVVDLRKKDQPKIHVRTWQSPEDLKHKGAQFELSEFF